MCKLTFSTRTRKIFFITLLTALMLSVGITTSLLSDRPSSLYSAGSGVGAQGLRLNLSVNSTTATSNGAFTITISDTNTLGVTNNLPRQNNWALGELANSACPSVDSSPLSVAVFKGVYSATNISSAQNVPLLPPGITFFCPSRDYTHFVFEPKSSVVTATGNSATNGVKFTMTTTITLRDYYNGVQLVPGSNTTSSSQFSHLPVGSYTVAGGDEWGDLVLVHLTVIGS
ncbi:MAG: hypothetical protein M1368_09770 [Thaumarchaeota archaeon]|nr:hypothetical protein [Nitrososphaerota archaeon]